METDEWRVTSEIDHLVDFLQELTVILERVPPSPVLEDALKQTLCTVCLLYTSPSPRDKRQSRMPSSA